MREDYYSPHVWNLTGKSRAEIIKKIYTKSLNSTTILTQEYFSILVTWHDISVPWYGTILGRYQSIRWIGPPFMGQGRRKEVKGIVRYKFLISYSISKGFGKTIFSLLGLNPRSGLVMTWRAWRSNWANLREGMRANLQLPSSIRPGLKQIQTQNTWCHVNN